MAVAVRAQSLRKLVQIMVPAFEPNDTGDPSQQTFTPLTETYMEMQALSGQQLVEARKIHAETTHRGTMRFAKGVTAACQVVWFSGAEKRTRTWEVVAVLNAEERDTMLTLLCKELPSG